MTGVRCLETDLLERQGYGPARLWSGGGISDLGEGQGNDINNNGIAVLGVPITGQGQPGRVVVPRRTARARTWGCHRAGAATSTHEFSIKRRGGGRRDAEVADRLGRAGLLLGFGAHPYLDPFGFAAKASSAPRSTTPGRSLGGGVTASDPAASFGKRAATRAPAFARRRH